MSEATCRQCGATFAPRKQTKGLFCSRACWYASEAARKPSRACEQCGKDFRLSPRDIARDQRCCSAACGRAYLNAKTVRKPIAERFWGLVEKSPEPNGCWLWIGGTDTRGYGKMFTERGKPVVSAHRFSYELANGPIAAGLFVLHRCDVPACIRPDHLFLGTAIDNMQDCIAKGRRANGIKSPPLILKPGQIAAIRAMRTAGWTTSRIATETGIPYGAVREAIASMAQAAAATKAGSA